jgi:rod shape-determining protein MreC
MNFYENFSINKKTSGLSKFLVGIICLLLFIFVLNIFSPSVKNIFYTLSAPLEKTFWSAGAASSGYIGSIFNAGSLNKENDKLKNENQKLISQIISLQALNSANRAQNDISTACLDKDFQLLMAEVIGMDGQDIISINKGSIDGISENMPVISQQNVLYGKIIKVFKNYSQIMLISNKKSIVNVKIKQKDTPPPTGDATTPVEEKQQELVKEIDGVIRGTGNLNIGLDLIPVDSPINQDDILVTSSLEKTFPKDLLIGKITKVEKNDQKPFQQADIQSFLDLNSIDNLFVITNYKR